MILGTVPRDPTILPLRQRTFRNLLCVSRALGTTPQNILMSYDSGSTLRAKSLSEDVFLVRSWVSGLSWPDSLCPTEKHLTLCAHFAGS